MKVLKQESNSISAVLRKVYLGCLLSCSVMSDSVAPWTVACQAPLSIGFSRQKYWSELPCPLSGDLPDPGIEPTFPALLPWQADSLALYHLILFTSDLIIYTRNFSGVYQYFSWVNPFHHFENEDFPPFLCILINTSSILHLSEFWKRKLKNSIPLEGLYMNFYIWTQWWFKRPALLKRRITHLIYYHDNPNKMKLLKLPCIGR